MSSPVLTLSDIYKSYHKGTSREVSVLNRTNFSVSSGEIVALVAPSGAGKSTLLHIAGLLDEADSGNVFLSGEKVTGRSDNFRTELRRNKIGFIYQSHHLLPEFSALENIVLPQLVAGVSKVEAILRANSLLKKVGIFSRRDHRPGTLSGGEQQRVAFCRAIANQPALLLADEPTGNLDPETAENVFNTLIELTHETGLAALVATHNLGLAGRMDRVIHLERGVITD
ncbi:MAG: ABC transporter ATP-binding protein [Rhodobacterales bacterium]|mgnify:FL=1|jgi:lipoprotein-releasing system ATP-binding protein|tara:strand:- start:1371 stop:2051 length:681 start_codon:yes stop_codon:yes gene_type:complete